MPGTMVDVRMYPRIDKPILIKMSEYNSEIVDVMEVEFVEVDSGTA